MVLVFHSASYKTFSSNLPLLFLYAYTSICVCVCVCPHVMFLSSGLLQALRINRQDIVAIDMLKKACECFVGDQDCLESMSRCMLLYGWYRHVPSTSMAILDPHGTWTAKSKNRI